MDYTVENAPTIEEIGNVIKELKNNKAPGIDNLPAELIKEGGNKLIYFLHKLFELIWIKETIPEEWKTGVICPIHKKGDPMLCKNYRPITLLPTIYKLLSKILYIRLLPYTEKNNWKLPMWFQTRERNHGSNFYTQTNYGKNKRI